ncbi:MAG: hypothetical protein ACI8WT_004638 [Clostridium sp.]|jgi:hypothetical protein
MGERYLNQEIHYFSDVEIAQYANDVKGTHFDGITATVSGLGISVVATSAFPPMAAAIATGLGLAFAINGVIDAIETAFNDSDLESVIDSMHDGQTLKVVTKYYEWSSASGNSYTYYSKETYTIL